MLCAPCNAEIHLDEVAVFDPPPPEHAECREFLAANPSCVFCQERDCDRIFRFNDNVRHAAHKACLDKIS